MKGDRETLYGGRNVAIVKANAFSAYKRWTLARRASCRKLRSDATKPKETIRTLSKPGILRQAN